MHILILINSLTSGGAERVTVHLSSYLAKKGHKVTVVTHHNKRDFYTLDKRVARIRINPKPKTLHPNRNTLKLKEVLRLAMRFPLLCVLKRFLPLPLRVLKRFLSLLCRLIWFSQSILKWLYVSIIRKILRRLLQILKRLSGYRFLKSVNFFHLRKVIKQQKPDIILGMLTSNAVKAIIASYGLPTKVVASERNFPGRKKASHRWGDLRKKFYRLADGHVVQTDKISCWLKQYTRASNIAIIPNSVSYPTTSFTPVIAPETVVSNESKVIIAAGRLHEQKGFDLLISAFHQIAQQIPGWKLVILGKDAGRECQRKNLQQQIDELDLNDRVKMPGCAGNISDWYRRSAIFVLSSRYEGFPNVLLEAMANGCSCISCDCDTGPSEIIINEKNGLLIDSEDIDSLADAIVRLAKDEKLRSHIAANAIKVREDFSEDRIMDMWIQFFEEVHSSSSGILNKYFWPKKGLRC